MTERRPSCVPAAASAAAGFSLIEVVMALMIAVLLCSAVASGLSVVLLDEQIQLRQMESALIPGSMLARQYGMAEDPAAPEGWEMETAELTERRDGGEEQWKIHSWTPTNRPGPRLVIARPATTPD